MVHASSWPRGVLLAAVLCIWVRPASAQDVRVDHDSTAHAGEIERSAAPVIGQTRRSRETAGSAEVIELDSLSPKPLGDFSDVLSSRIPGVLVEQPSGATGAGARIHIRGIDNLVLPGDPLVIVDGVRVANATTISTVDVGGQVPSRLDALDPEEIETIEVLPGPASAAMYGGDAADGVVLITTHHGQPGRPVWRLHTQYGVINDVASYPANFGRIDTTPTSGLFKFPCSLDQESRGLCMPGPLTSWNPLENVSPFHVGTTQRHGVSVSGGSRAITYYVAGDYDRQDGVYADNNEWQTHMNASVTGHLGQTLDLTLTSSYVDGRARLPMGGRLYSGFIGISSYRSVIADGLFGAGADDPVTRGYADSLSTVLTRQVGPPEEMHQSTIGASMRWQPSTWLRSTNTIGFDRVHLSSSAVEASQLVFGGPPGDSAVDRHAQAYHSGWLSAQSDWEASYGRTARLSASSSIGLRYERQRVHDRQQSETVAFSGSLRPSLVASSNTEFDPDASTVGLYVQQRFAWRSRIFVSAGLRQDRTYHPAFDPARKSPSVIDGSANVTWLVSSEPFFPHVSWLDALRVRAAYGNTGRFLVATMFPPARVEGWPFLPANPLVPERTREMEAGFDAALFHGRLGVSLSYYDKRSTHLAAVENLPISVASSAFGPFIGQDNGAIRNRGYETLLSATPIRTRDLSWDLTVAWATNRNTLDDYSGGGVFFLNDVQRLVTGYAAPGYWGRRFTYADADGDSIISRDEVQLDTAASFLGSAIPTHELSIAPSLTLFGSVTLSALLDYRGGFKQYNENEAVRCGDALASTCRAAEDPAAPLADQAAAIAGILGSDPAYIDDATFWKLREVAITLSAPHSWAGRLAASDLRLTLAGRNLATWTRYPGLDPEINATPSDPLVRSDFATQPPVRYLTARVDVVW